MERNVFEESCISILVEDYSVSLGASNHDGNYDSSSVLLSGRASVQTPESDTESKENLRTLESVYSEVFVSVSEDISTPFNDSFELGAFSCDGDKIEAHVRLNSASFSSLVNALTSGHIVSSYILFKEPETNFFEKGVSINEYHFKFNKKA